MKIRVAELRDSSTFFIKGDEKWLDGIYESFCLRPDGSWRDRSNKIVGQIRVDPIPGDVVHVSGQITYRSELTCGRCGDDVPLPIEATIDAYYENERQSDLEKRELNLARADLERYFIQDGCIDLEALINESLQLQIPLRNIRSNDDGSKCLVCDADLSEPMVYREDTPDEKISPFAVLGSKNLKH